MHNLLMKFDIDILFINCSELFYVMKKMIWLFCCCKQYQFSYIKLRFEIFKINCAQSSLIFVSVSNACVVCLLQLLKSNNCENFEYQQGSFNQVLVFDG
jgi:hypothetical protein